MMAKWIIDRADAVAMQRENDELHAKIARLRATLEAIEQNCLSVSREPEIEADPVQRLAWEITAKMATTALAEESSGANKR